MVKFISKCKNLTILVKPYVINMINNVPQHEHSKVIKFNNGEFTTNNKEEVAFLRKHPGNGIDFVEVKQEELAMVK